MNAPGPAPAPVRPQRMAAGWFLGCFAAVFAVLLWSRGLGRLLLPLFAIGFVVVLGMRIVKAIREPLR